jgi:ABC-type Na+ efflux pump permease subunit
MMVLMHGQSISKSLIVEKNSKLMETLLISVKPYAIIFGKILAMYTVAIIQMAIWIASGVLGFVLGDNLATKMYDGYSNPVTDVIKIMREGTTAFTTQSYIMAIIFFAAGFLFYCVLSAFLTSNITKTEELSNGSSIYQIIVAIGYIVSYLIPLMQEKSIVVKILRYIPITSAFMIPADVIVGNIGILGSLISMCILLVTTFIMIIITGKIYKKKVF